MNCPYCRDNQTRVIDTTHDARGGVRRRRTCLNCNQRFSTYERAILSAPLLMKRDGMREEFDREKLARGLRIACAKRPVSAADIDNDGVSDEDDTFPQDPAASVDSDDDGKPDSWNRGKDSGDSTTGLELDDDDDGDGISDDDDAFPLDPDEDTDTDGDGIGNNEDDDDDGDGTLDIRDPDPLDPQITGPPPESPWYIWVISSANWRNSNYATR